MGVKPPVPLENHPSARGSYVGTLGSSEMGHNHRLPPKSVTHRACEEGLIHPDLPTIPGHAPKTRVIYTLEEILGACDLNLVTTSMLDGLTREVFPWCALDVHDVLPFSYALAMFPQTRGFRVSR